MGVAAASAFHIKFAPFPIGARNVWISPRDQILTGARRASRPKPTIAHPSCCSRAAGAAAQINSFGSRCFLGAILTWQGLGGQRCRPRQDCPLKNCLRLNPDAAFNVSLIPTHQVLRLRVEVADFCDRQGPITTFKARGSAPRRRRVLGLSFARENTLIAADIWLHEEPRSRRAVFSSACGHSGFLPLGRGGGGPLRPTAGRRRNDCRSYAGPIPLRPALA